MQQQPIDAFICVHRRDISYLFDLVVQSYMLNFSPKGRLVLISNDQPYLEAYIQQAGFSDRVSVTSDDQWLSKREMSLPGWFRQQIIKLRAYQFCETEHFCNIGADTLLLQPIETSDLIADNFPILYYRSHMPPLMHWWYELQRTFYDARILKVRPVRALRYVDFINDLFCFNRSVLESLNRDIERMYGADGYYALLRGLNTTPRDQKKFGEWTLYSVYLLDRLRRKVVVRNSAGGFLRQVHSERDFRNYRFDSKAVHFVGKQFDVERIKRSLARYDLALGTKLHLEPAGH